MRSLILAGAAFAVAFAAQAQTSLIGSEGFARLGGSYATVATGDAARCAQLCDQDNICMAWTWRAAPQGCELKAVAPPPTREAGATSGLSARAPAFLHEIAAKPPEPPIASGPLPTRPPVPAAHQATPVAATDDLESELLGGPNGDAIRPRLGDTP